MVSLIEEKHTIHGPKDVRRGRGEADSTDSPAVTKNDVASGFGFRHFRLRCHRLLPLLG